MRLYVCWGTFPVPSPRRDASWRPGAHPCKRAHDALKDAGHSPEVVKSYGFSFLPDFTEGSKQAKRLTGESHVPVLVLDDGQVISDSRDCRLGARQPCSHRLTPKQLFSMQSGTSANRRNRMLAS